MVLCHPNSKHAFLVEAEEMPSGPLRDIWRALVGMDGFVGFTRNVAEGFTVTCIARLIRGHREDE